MTKKVYFAHDSFVNYKGETQNFTVAVVLNPVKDLIVMDTKTAASSDIIARVGLGVAICNASDEFDTVKGEKIAEGRANVYIDNSIAITNRAMLNLVTEDALHTLLEKEVEYVKNHPADFIDGYAKAEQKYLRTKKMEELYSKMKPEERAMIDGFRNDTVSDEYIQYCILHYAD